MAYFKTIQYKNGFKSLEAQITEVCKKALSKNNFYDNRIILEWRAIVGEEYAIKVTPFKIVKNSNIHIKHSSHHLDSPSKTQGCTLYLTSRDRAFVANFIYVKDVIIKRIQEYLGTAEIVDLKLYTGK